MVGQRKTRSKGKGQDLNYLPSDCPDQFPFHQPFDFLSKNDSENQIDDIDLFDKDKEFKEMNPEPLLFLETLRSQFGSSDEFTQFERFFYAQKEEVQVLRHNVETFRSTLVKLEDEKRVLELQLVSEKANREQDSIIASTDQEKNNMQLNTQIYSIKCEGETWKRKAEATHKESMWLKQQLKSLELEKTETVRKLEEFSRQKSEMDQYRMSIETYLKRVKETLTDIQMQIVDLEKTRATLISVTEYNEKETKIMATCLQNREKALVLSDSRISELQSELIQVKAQLVQNSAELTRTRKAQKSVNEVVTKLVQENKDLHEGFNTFLSSLGELDLDKLDIGALKIDLDKDKDGDILNTIPKLHEEVEKALQNVEVVPD